MGVAVWWCVVAINMFLSVVKKKVLFFPNFYSVLYSFFPYFLFLFLFFLFFFLPFELSLLSKHLYRTFVGISCGLSVGTYN